MEARYTTNKQWFYIYKPIVTTIFLLFAANVWSSSDHQAPNSIVGATNVDAEELIGLFEKYPVIPPLYNPIKLHNFLKFYI